jgi:hypothetical protein
MQRDGRFVGWPLRVRESFEERVFRLHAVGEGSPTASGGDASLQAI